MKIKYREIRLQKASLALVEKANQILSYYEERGVPVTLRQLYYRFVALDWFPDSWKDKKTGSTNNMRSYKNLACIINDARLTGLISWTAIIDRTRGLESRSTWENPGHACRSIAEQYHEDLWADQPKRVELWVEKDAITGTVERVCNEFSVPFLSCRGYTSQSEMWASAQRLHRHEDAGQQAIVLHLGDHDPSGVDMTRDVDDRLVMFMGGITMERIALNMDQVRKYKPPPNPAKITDKRAKGYIRTYGRKSWELDAIEPDELVRIVRKAIEGHLDRKKWKKSNDRMEENRRILMGLEQHIPEDKR